MGTRLVTLLWLMAIVLLAVGGDRSPRQTASSEIAVTAPERVAHLRHVRAARRVLHVVQTHHALPAGDVTSSVSRHGGHLSMHRSAPNFSKRSTLTAADRLASRKTDVFALVWAIGSITDPPLTHNPARAPPA